jgi:PAS domain S-box-containing protein
VSTVAQVQHGRLGPFVGWVRSFIIVALVGRQVLSLLENSSLARHLEARVIERTAELRASEQRFQALVQHSSEVVILVNRNGLVEYVSESMTRVFGYRDEELLGQPLGDVLDAGAAARLREGLAEAAQRPYGVLELELPLQHRAGQQCTAQLTVTNLLYVRLRSGTTCLHRWGGWRPFPIHTAGTLVAAARHSGSTRGTSHLSDGTLELRGEQDIFGVRFDSRSWAATSLAGTSWTGGTFNGSAWTGTSWSGTIWSGRMWSTGLYS